MKLKMFCVAAVALAMGTSAHASVNLVKNGGFETDSLTIAHEFGASFIFGQTVANWQSLSKTAFNVWEPSGLIATTVDAKDRFDNVPPKATGQYLWTLPGNADPDGGAFLLLDGDAKANGAVQQLITGLKVGATYTLSFDWAAAQYKSRVGKTTEKLQVDFGGDTFTTAILPNLSKSATDWFTVTHTFKATSTSELLSFLSIGTPLGLPPVALLDGVSLTTNVPEPASWTLMIVGFFGLGGMLRNRRKVATA